MYKINMKPIRNLNNFLDEQICLPHMNMYCMCNAYIEMHMHVYTCVVYK